LLVGLIRKGDGLVQAVKKKEVHGKKTLAKRQLNRC